MKAALNILRSSITREEKFLDDRSRDSFSSVNSDSRKEIDINTQSCVKTGSLQMKTSTKWEVFYFILLPTELLRCSSESENGTIDIKETYKLDATCCVFETTPGSFTGFKVVISDIVLHFMGDDEETMHSWIRIIGDLISQFPEDPLLQAALNRIDDDDFYDVLFLEHKPLVGLIFTRICEWAIVKTSNFKQTGVYPGSILSSINDEVVYTQPYKMAVQKLKSWEPPLKLTFRRAPSKIGYLHLKNIKNATSRRSSRNLFNSSWSKKFFILREGHLLYQESDNENATVKEDFQLRGCYVSLISEIESSNNNSSIKSNNNSSIKSNNDTDRPYCLQLESKGSYLVVSGDSSEDIMDWAIAIYHSIILANGGSYVVSRERKRLIQLKQLEEEAAYKKKIEEENKIKKELKKERDLEINRKLLQAIELNDMNALRELIKEIEVIEDNDDNYNNNNNDVDDSNNIDYELLEKARERLYTKEKESKSYGNSNNSSNEQKTTNSYPFSNLICTRESNKSHKTTGRKPKTFHETSEQDTHTTWFCGVF
eukprot:gene1399-2691_t